MNYFDLFSDILFYLVVIIFFVSTTGQMFNKNIPEDDEYF